ncbi:hypothetical protein Gasu2_36890 [Galdieria sulphuraria]|uniref:Uncharacterized protein n=1 Tax=Galdieria sulphuraria TaxID=130081 RepID=M2WWB5_GALSU|nr:uncharacterized protein Gasu_41480 [Galdieria sulphuraria]EME28300.1 hypothetical protein Gasu_41480 [Galdieria sulphuraria]GJD09433.1 hypothetical protein Gasu2_36890 [Galdieria sulphuraria]|eukprot:XP_005704820.1 hypothetical protein Gasu_41480 [Galdieria sulphuraria]
MKYCEYYKSRPLQGLIVKEWTVCSSAFVIETIEKLLASVGRRISSVVSSSSYNVAYRCLLVTCATHPMDSQSGKGTSREPQKNEVEDEEGFQKVVKRNRRIVRNIPNNAGPRGRGKSTGQDRRPTFGAQQNQPLDRGRSNNRSSHNRTVRELNRGNGRPLPEMGHSKFQDRGRVSNSSQNHRVGRGGANVFGNSSSRTVKGSREDKEATDRGYPKSKGFNRGGRGGGDGRGEVGGRVRNMEGRRGGFVGESHSSLNNRQGRKFSGPNNEFSRERGRDSRNNARVGDRRGGGRTDSSRGTYNSRDNRLQKGDKLRNDKGRFANDRKDSVRKRESDGKNSKKVAAKKERGVAPKFTEDSKHKLTFYLPFNSRYLRAWVDPGNEFQTPKRNDSGIVKVAFRSTDMEMLQNEEGIVVTNEKWTEESPSGKKIELVRVLLPSNIRSVYEIQQSGEPTPIARKVKKASFVVDPGLIVA